MEKLVSGKIKKSKDRHAPEVSLQTGFPSAATHYHEASIDLHNELIYNQDATFFIRVEGNSWNKFNVRHNDVLIIDRSAKLKQNRLALVVQDGEFDVIRFSENQAKSEFLLWGVVTYIIKDVL